MKLIAQRRELWNFYSQNPLTRRRSEPPPLRLTYWFIAAHNFLCFSAAALISASKFNCRFAISFCTGI